MPLRIGHRTTRLSGRVVLAMIRTRFARTTRQKALRDRARAVVGELIGRPEKQTQNSD